MKKYVIWSQFKRNHDPPFGIVEEKSYFKNEANLIYMQEANQNEVVILIDTNTQKIIKQKGDFTSMYIALNKNFPNWHK